MHTRYISYVYMYFVHTNRPPTPSSSANTCGAKYTCTRCELCIHTYISRLYDCLRSVQLRAVLLLHLGCCCSHTEGFSPACCCCQSHLHLKGPCKHSSENLNLPLERVWKICWKETEGRQQRYCCCCSD